MKGWRPYQIGVWMSNYLNHRCQLCHFYPSVNHSIVHQYNTPQVRSVNRDWRYQQNAGYYSHSRLENIGYRLDSLLASLDTGILCDCCHQSIHWLPDPLSVELNDGRRLNIQHCTYYQHPIDSIIRRFKLHQDMAVLPILVHMISQLPPPKGCNAENSAILPMPTTRKRLKNRGFDPLSIITPYLSKHWGIPIWQGVERVDDTVSQRGLSKIERLQNIKGAFCVMGSIPADKLILFDDVATTGASLRELANTILSINKSIPLSAYCLAHGNSMF